jgi:hypothetical protein
VLRTYARLESPPETVLELREEGYVVIGDVAHIRRGDREQSIRLLLESRPGKELTVDEVLSLWIGEPKPSKRAVQKDLEKGAEQGWWHRCGRGTKGDAHRFVSRTGLLP